MDELQYRTYEQPFEVRNLSQRLVCGRVLPYGHDQQISPMLTERFERGAFNHQLRAANRVRFFNNHSIHGGQHIGAGARLEDTDDGLWGEFRIANSQIGDHYLQMAREGMLTQWSAGFVPQKERRDGTTVVYTRAQLFEVAFVEQGAYGELAAVAAVRQQAVPPLSRDLLLAKLPARRLPM